jgi:hypothetical protein
MISVSRSTKVQARTNTVLGFAVLVGLGVVGAGWGLLGHRPKSSPQVA